MSITSDVKPDTGHDGESEMTMFWDDVRHLGIPMWMKCKESLRNLCQHLADKHYLINKNPADAAVFYILLGKKSILAKLYEINGNEKVSGFLSNDFNHARWKHAAETNAYVSIQKHNMHTAVAMFLLAGNLSNAVDVCLDKVNDYMLALFVAKIASDMDNGVQLKRVLQIGLNNARANGDKHKEKAFVWLLNEQPSSQLVIVPNATPVTAPSQVVHLSVPAINLAMDFNPDLIDSDTDHTIEIMSNLFEGLALHQFLIEGNAAVSLDRFRMDIADLRDAYQSCRDEAEQDVKVLYTFKRHTDGNLYPTGIFESELDPYSPEADQMRRQIEGRDYPALFSKIKSFIIQGLSQKTPITEIRSECVAMLHAERDKNPEWTI